MSISEQFHQDGYVTGLQIMTEQEIESYRNEFSRLEADMGERESQVGIFGMHRKNRFVWELATHPRILDAIEAALGADILLLGTHFFCKYPNLSESFVAWHQDITYWSLDPLAPGNVATAWLAIDDADTENGCMRVIPGTHRSMLKHGESQEAGNLLSVNQEIPEELLDPSQAVDLILKAGMASLHDGLTVHGSNPNRSARRRCGLTIRFTKPQVKPKANADGKMKQWLPFLVRGEDRYGHFELSPAPTHQGQTAG